MMKTSCLGVVIAAFALAACGDDQAPGEADVLLAEIRADNYRSWARAPGYDKRRSSDAPHSDEVDIYVNDVVSGALAGGQPLTAWPEGSLIVKDGWDGSDLELVAVMEKRADGWFWAEYFDGKSKYSGKPDLCIDCHASGADMVRAFRLPK